MKKRSWKVRILLILVSLIALAAVVGTILNLYVVFSAKPYIYADLKEIPEAYTILVLGAKVQNNGDLSDMLKDRMISGLEVYNSGKGKRFLLSGDHGTKEYDEVEAMKNFLINKGVPEEDIFLDHAGFDTYDSVYRAKEIFEVDSVIVVTQEFHLTRAVYAARAMGMNAYGYIADKQEYVTIEYNELRELPARSKIFFDILFDVGPKFLGEKIPITRDSLKSWD